MQSVLVAQNQIDFPTLGPEIGSEKFEALAPELFLGGALAEFSVAEMLRFDLAMPPGADTSQQIHSDRMVLLITVPVCCIVAVPQ